MYFCHHGDIWEEFPQLVPGLLLLEGIHPQADPEPVIQTLLQKAQERLALSNEGDMPEVAAWRKAFSRMGFKPTKYRSAAEALLRRFRKEGNFPRLHPLVDLCNAVSLAFALPVAVLDLDRVGEYLEVCHATGEEEYLAFNDMVEHPVPGEVIFRDGANHAHARRWTFRQSKRSVVRPETRRALIISEGLHETAQADIPSLLEVLAREIAELWKPPRKLAVLSVEAPRLVF